MEIEFFSTAEELKADRVPRKYANKELIAQIMQPEQSTEFVSATILTAINPDGIH